MPQTHIYIDESGDLGALRGFSHFTVAALVTWNRKRIERIPLRIRKRRLKKSIARKAELKFHNSNDRIRRMLFSILMEKNDFYIATVTIDKKDMKSELTMLGDKVFNVLIVRLISDIIIDRALNRDFILTIDPRRSGKISDQMFDSHIRIEIGRLCSRLGIIPPSIRISRLDSQVSKGLQVADFIAGAIRRKYELSDNTYYDIISNSIKIERKHLSSCRGLN